MTEGTCAAGDCTNTGKLRRGWCDGCYHWSWRNGWADPTGRPRRPKTIGQRCKTRGCLNAGALVRGWCDTCYQWSRRRGWVDPADRPGLQPKRQVPSSCIIVENSEPCPKPVYNKLHGLCKAHDTRRIRHGSPTAPKSRRSGGELALALHKAAHTTANDCIILKSRRKPRLTVRYEGKRMTASRAVWWIRYGDPGDHQVLHRCNGGSGANGCINVNHLYLGTPGNNSSDMLRAGRSNRGSDRPNAKLTEAQVRELRHRYLSGGVTQQSLADEYGIALKTAQNIIHRKRWAWLS